MKDTDRTYYPINYGKLSSCILQVKGSFTDNFYLPSLRR